MRSSLWVLAALFGAGCSDKSDCGAIATWYEDRDGDGYGSPDEEQFACEAPVGFIDNGDDCDDRDVDVYPGAPEICGDAEVNDCGGTAEEAALACAVSGAVSAADGSNAVVSGDGAARLGADVASAGDLDGDGVADLLLGAPGDATGGADAGAAWVLYGGQSGALDSSDVVARLTGEAAGDLAGQSVAGAGDLNGDGDGDLLIGAPGADDGAGRVYLVLQDLDDDLALSDADAIFDGATASDGAGTAIAGVGDINEDDELDIAIGAPGADDGAGRIYLITDAAEGGGSLSDYDRVLQGTISDGAAGSSVAGVDLNGDGDVDLLVGAPGASQIPEGGDDVPRNGGVYGVFDSFVEATSLDDADVKLFGDVDGDLAGTAVVGLGDMDGDGYEDFGVTAPSQGFGGPECGAAYVVSGPFEERSYGVLASVAIARFDGGTEQDAAGQDMASPGDMDGDGAADLAISVTAESTAAEGAGAVYVVFGPLSGTVGVDQYSGTDLGTVALMYLGGEASAALGTALAPVGDQDKTGTAELLAGAPGLSSGSGAAYVLRAAGY